MQQEMLVTNQKAFFWLLLPLVIILCIIYFPQLTTQNYITCIPYLKKLAKNLVLSTKLYLKWTWLLECISSFWEISENPIIQNENLVIIIDTIYSIFLHVFLWNKSILVTNVRAFYERQHQQFKKIEARCSRLKMISFGTLLSI